MLHIMMSKDNMKESGKERGTMKQGVQRKLNRIGERERVRDITFIFSFIKQLRGISKLKLN